MEGPLLRNLPTVTAVLAVVMFVTGGCYVLVSLQLILSGIAVNGTIVDTLRWTGIFSEGDEKYEHYPIVRFQTVDGTEIEITTSEYHGFSPDFETDDHLPFAVGDEIRVFYLPESPNDAKVDNVDELWAWPIFLSKAGAVLTIIATILRVIRARYRKKNNAETLDPWYHLHGAI